MTRARYPTRGRACVVRLLILASLLAPSPVVAQYTKSTYFETWTDLATIYNVNDRFRYDGQYGVRAWPWPEDFSQIFLRPSVRLPVGCFCGRQAPGSRPEA